ncbi:MAG: CehA/McbA family metallohydrolase [Kofleriaceae bacterium]
MFRMSIRLALVASLVTACGDDDVGGGLEDYFPDLPAPTGEAQRAFAGPITAANASDLLTGPSATGLVGDYVIKNDVASFVISAPARFIAVVPTGGNLIDAALTDGTSQLVGDQFGELSLLYLFGRTCEHETIEVVRDGAGGGVAVLRARGHSANNDFINIKGIGVFTVDVEVDPTLDDHAECATTYVLAPGSTTLQTYFSLYNAGESPITGPYGTLADSGGEVEVWGNGRGFERAGLEDITALAEPAPVDYVVYQAPGVAYGIAPRHATPTDNSAYLISGVSLMLLGNDNLFDILNPDEYFVSIPVRGGHLQQIDVIVGRDASDIDASFRTARGEALVDVAGTVTWSGGGPAVGARVGVFADGDGDGVIDDDEAIVSYLDVGADGAFAGQVPAGNHLLRAEVADLGRSQTVAAGTGAALTVPSPIRVDFSILDDDTNTPMPGRLLVVGTHPAYPDQRVFSTYDRLTGVVRSVHAIRGTTVDLGDGADPALRLPAGGNYRIFATHGTRYSSASQPVSGRADVDLEFRLRQVSPATGYLATDWHVHQIDSPDSPVPSDARLRSAVSSGIDMFASTDHDFVSNLQPLVEELGLETRLRVISGLEMTPFAYGHFQAWPLEPDPLSPNRGAIDWAQGRMGGECDLYGPWCSMTPQEILDAARARGARMLQINHPRASGLTKFQALFDRAKLTYDYDDRTIFGDFEQMEVPYDYLRLPGESLWTDDWNGLEVWNGFGMADSDGDGRREITSFDRVLADWFNMLSLGFVVSPTGSSDTHTDVVDPVGMPRTMVRVADPSPAALASGDAVEEVLAVTTGAVARDIVLTDGPMLEVEVAGQPAIGRTITPGASVTFDVSIVAPDWAAIDTLEVFANATPPSPGDPTALVPLKCWTSRDVGTLPAADPCALAPLTAEAMVVTLVDLGGGFSRYEVTMSITLDPADVAAATRAGATGTDAWFVLRARGDRAIFPVMTQGAIDPAVLPTLVAGDPVAIDAAMQGRGVQAAAMTAPIYVDFDGGGYRAPFAP